MRKVMLYFFVGILLSLLAPASAQASLVVVKSDGELVFNVLSSEGQVELQIPKSESVSIKEVVSDPVSRDAKVGLAKADGKVTLNVQSANDSRSMDITSYEDDVVEIENRPQVEKLSIALRDNNFVLEQLGILAVTEYEININPENASVSLLTPSGERYLSIFPKQAVETTIRSKLINNLTSNPLIVEESGELTYNISGEKVLSIFNLFDYATPVTVKVSAQTAEVVSVEQPKWLGVLSFIFQA